MNPKQSVPLIAKLSPLVAAAPPLLVFAGIGLTLYWLFSDEKQKKPNVPADAENERKSDDHRERGAETGRKPAEAKPFPPNTAPAAARVSSAATPGAISPAAVRMTPLRERRAVTREDMAAIFNHGVRHLTKRDAVIALEGRNFRKTAAYKALSQGGRFATWLQFSPDGVITWNG
jgi:hypothetical protein